MYNLAVYYGDGRGVPRKDLREALRWSMKTIECKVPDGPFGESARIGISMAHNMLGNWYFHGIELEKNETLALKHWRQGAKLHCPPAYNMLGYCWMGGECGLRRNVANARDCFRLACSTEPRLSESMRNIGALWIELHCERMALRWVKAAYEFGDTDASELINDLRDASLEAEDSETSRSRIPSHLLSALTNFDETTISLTCAPPPTFRCSQPRPSLEELLLLPNASPYLRLLIDVKQMAVRLREPVDNRNIQAVVNRLRMVARMYMLPDSQIVLDRHDVKLATLFSIWLDHRTVVTQLNADEQALLEFKADARAHSGDEPLVIGLLQVATKKHPDCVSLLTQLGCLLMFQGACHDGPAGLASLTKALHLVESNPSAVFREATRIDLLYLVGTGHMQQPELDEQTMARAELFFRRFVSEMGQFGHRKEGHAHFQLGMLAIRRLDGASARKHYDLGVVVHDALPEFLQDTDFSYRRQLASALSLLDAHAHPDTRPTTINRRGGQALVVPGVDERWFAGDNVMLDWLRERYVSNAELSRAQQGKLAVKWSMRPPKNRVVVHASPNTPRAILLDELLSFNKDVQFLGRVLTVVVVAEPVKMSAIQAIVEDGRRDAIVVALYGADDSLLPRLKIGTVLEIRDPYSRITQHHTTQVRVDNPDGCVVIRQQSLSLCWLCLSERQPESLKQCARCKRALYCSPECQRHHWSKFGHKFHCNA
jgi:hypothetical protein